MVVDLNRMSTPDPAMSGTSGSCHTPVRHRHSRHGCRTWTYFCGVALPEHRECAINWRGRRRGWRQRSRDTTRARRSRIHSGSTSLTAACGTTGLGSFVMWHRRYRSGGRSGAIARAVQCVERWWWEIQHKLHRHRPESPRMGATESTGAYRHTTQPVQARSTCLGIGKHQ